jgi:hypothetical protein
LRTIRRSGVLAEFEAEILSNLEAWDVSAIELPAGPTNHFHGTPRRMEEGM